MSKKILILTAGYGEGHNSAARGLREGFARVAPEAIVDLRDLFAEHFGAFHRLVRWSYLTLINRWPRAWGSVYRWLDRKSNFENDFARFGGLKNRLRKLIDQFQPDIVVSVFPAYPYLLNQIYETSPPFRNVVIITDSITVNAIWYRCRADLFLAPNEQSATIVRQAGIASEKVRAFGFPVSTQFADLVQDRQSPNQPRPRVLYMINAGTASAPDLVRQLLTLEIDLTVTVGRNEALRRAVENVVGDRKIDIVGWTKEMPRLLCESDLLIGKAGGAAVQETIAARCPMIINHVVSGQEEGNARLLAETNSGAIAQSPNEVARAIREAFADDARIWRGWRANISALSRPRASLEIAEYLMSI